MMQYLNSELEIHFLKLGLLLLVKMVLMLIFFFLNYLIIKKYLDKLDIKLNYCPIIQVPFSSWQSKQTILQIITKLKYFSRFQNI